MTFLFLSLGLLCAFWGACNGVTVDCSGSSPLTTTYSGDATPVRTVGNTLGGGGISVCESALYAHNKVRDLHQSTVSLTYDDSLAAQSEAWSITLANEAKANNDANIYHSTRNLEGENVYYTASSWDVSTSVAEAAFKWYNEAVDCSYNYNTATGSCITGHFTQVVWKATTQVGCGVAKVSFDGFNHYFITCQYLSQGNFVSVQLGMSYAEARLLAYTSNVKNLKPGAVQPTSSAQLEKEDNGCFDKFASCTTYASFCSYDFVEKVCLKTCASCTP